MRKYAIPLALACAFMCGCTEENTQGSQDSPTQDGFAIVYSSVAMTTESGISYDIAISLKSAPIADVYLTAASSNPSEGQPQPASIVFNAANYNIPQVIKVVGQDDSIADGNQTYIVTVHAASADPAYNSSTIVNVTLARRCRFDHRSWHHLRYVVCAQERANSRCHAIHHVIRPDRGHTTASIDYL